MFFGESDYNFGATPLSPPRPKDGEVARRVFAP
jgi:hypothetical protein